MGELQPCVQSQSARSLVLPGKDKCGGQHLDRCGGHEHEWTSDIKNGKYTVRWSTSAPGRNSGRTSRTCCLNGLDDERECASLVGAAKWAAGYHAWMSSKSASCSNPSSLTPSSLTPAVGHPSALV